MFQKPVEALKGAAVDDGLRLAVVAGYNVANRPQSGGLNGRIRVRQQVDEPSRHAGVENGLDLVVRAVGEVRKRPARIGDDLVVLGEDQMREARDERLDELEARLGLAAAQVGQRPRGQIRCVNTGWDVL